MVTCLFFYSCGAPQTYSLQHYLKTADSASVAFYSPGDTNLHITINDKASVEKLGGFIDGENSAPVKCGDSGSIWFYEGGKKKMEVNFSMTGDCHVFSYMLNDKLHTRIMSSDAQEYITGIKDIAVQHL